MYNSAQLSTISNRFDIMSTTGFFWYDVEKKLIRHRIDIVKSQFDILHFQIQCRFFDIVEPHQVMPCKNLQKCCF